MSDDALVDADPIVESPAPAREDEEFREHARTYNGFVHLAMWFCFHIPLLLGGLYFMTIGGSVWGGAILFAAGIAVLLYGIVSSATGAAAD